MNKTIKILVFMAMLIVVLSSNIYADTTTKTIMDEAKGWTSLGKEQAKKQKDTINTELLYKNSNIIYNILLWVGTGVAIIVGAILGIQFMTAGIDQKVEVKKTLPAYIISCVVLFGSLGIWKLVVTLLKGVG